MTLPFCMCPVAQGIFHGSCSFQNTYRLTVDLVTYWLWKVDCKPQEQTPDHWKKQMGCNVNFSLVDLFREIPWDLFIVISASVVGTKVRTEGQFLKSQTHSIIIKTQQIDCLTQFLVLCFSTYFCTTIQTRAHFHMELIGQKIWFVYVNSYQSVCDNSEINPCISHSHFLITLLCCLSSAANSWKEEAFSIRTSPPIWAPLSATRFVIVCVCVCVWIIW